MSRGLSDLTLYAKIIYMINWRSPKVKKLAQAFLSLKTESDTLNFLRDLCTLDELEELSTRLEIARMLGKGVSYRKIAERTKVSTTTVTRIAYWFEHGEGGYKNIISKNKR